MVATDNDINEGFLFQFSFFICEYYRSNFQKEYEIFFLNKLFNISR